MNSLREEIKRIEYISSVPPDIDRLDPQVKKNYQERADDVADEILRIFEKRIDKVEKDYKKVLTPYLKKQPMKDVYPKQMDALNRIRKEMLK